MKQKIEEPEYTFLYSTVDLSSQLAKVGVGLHL